MNVGVSSEQKATETEQIGTHGRRKDSAAISSASVVAVLEDGDTAALIARIGSAEWSLNMQRARCRRSRSHAGCQD
jgi:hypothetical protein